MLSATSPEGSGLVRSVRLCAQNMVIMEMHYRHQEQEVHAQKSYHSICVWKMMTWLNYMYICTYIHVHQ